MGLTMVLDPTGTDGRDGKDVREADLESLSGKTVGIRHDKLWESFDWVTSEWHKALEAEGANVVLWRSTERNGKDGDEVTERFNEFVGSVDAVVSGLATCGSCTMLTVSDAVSAAQRGLPAVAVCTTQFEPLAHMLATRDGRPNLKMVVLPFPLETRPEDEVRDIARKAFGSLKEALGVVSS